MSKAEEKVALIKWKNSETEIEELLKGHTKAHLLDLAASQGAAVKKSWNKAKIVQRLSEKIVEQAETIYHPVLKDILVRLPDLETTAYRVNDLKEIEGFIPLIEKGFFFAAKDKDGILLLIPEEILFSVKDRLTPDGRTNELDEQNAETDRTSADSEFRNSGTSTVDSSRKAELLNSWHDKTLAIYGTVSLEHLKQTWNRYFDEAITVEEISDLLN